ncbi:macrophage migration inhibitory factor homolog [Magallana gigas]|uniref:L-dopachrome isomerase n=1 Tax=Magallana gigas TaxID=29159 RepID=A0A8W8K8M9_MAGGI|nr:macrophage migration inhibitory factor homolog [Crassostrea gigas]
MPTFAVYTNLPNDKVPGDFLQQASAFLANQLGKPESYVTVRVHPGQMMTHGGSSDLCASVELYNITDGAKNKEHAAAIAKFVESKLSIPQNRFYVTFTNLRREDVALDGKTFA